MNHIRKVRIISDVPSLKTSTASALQMLVVELVVVALDPLSLGGCLDLGKWIYMYGFKR